MSAAEQFPEPGYRHERSFHQLVWRESSLSLRVSLVLDALGIFVLVLSALALFGSGLAGDETTAGWLIRLCITALNGAVLMLATARVLDFIDKLSTRNRTAARSHALRRSADQPAPEDRDTASVSAAAADLPEVAPTIVFKRPWRTSDQPARDRLEGDVADERREVDGVTLTQRDGNPDGTPPRHLH